MSLSYLQCSGTQNEWASCHALVSRQQTHPFLLSFVVLGYDLANKISVVETDFIYHLSIRSARGRPEGWRGSRRVFLPVYSLFLFLPLVFISFTEAVVLHPEVSSLFPFAVLPTPTGSTALPVPGDILAEPVRRAPQGPSSELLSVNNSNFSLGSSFVFPGLQNLLNDYYINFSLLK